MAAPTWWARRVEFLEGLCHDREAYALSLEHAVALRTRWTEQATRHAQGLEATLVARTEEALEAARYARRLEELLAETARGAREGNIGCASCAEIEPVRELGSGSD